MADYTILSEQRLEIYKDINTKIWQRVITYQAEGFAPRTVWIDESALPDAVWQLKNSGKTVPSDIQAQSDKIRRAYFDADIAKIKSTPAPRKI